MTMKKELYCTAGCYLDQNPFKMVVTSPVELTDEEFDEAVSDYLHDVAMEVTYGFVGLHGFCDDEDLTEEDMMEEVTYALDYHYEDWDEELYGPDNLTVEEIEIDRPV